MESNDFWAKIKLNNILNERRLNIVKNFSWNAMSNLTQQAKNSTAFMPYKNHVTQHR